MIPILTPLRQPTEFTLTNLHHQWTFHPQHRLATTKSYVPSTAMGMSSEGAAAGKNPVG